MNNHMKVFGRNFPAPRLTTLGAALMALAIAVPLGSLIGILAWIAS